MDYKHVFELLAELRERVSAFELDIANLGHGVTGPVTKALDRTREGTSLLRGLLWSVTMAVEMERERS